MAVVALIVAIYFVNDRRAFLAGAEHTTGRVVAVASKNGLCGGNKISENPCTRFYADVVFSTDLKTGHIRVSAGEVREYNQPVSMAQYRQGDSVPIIYNPKRIAQAYREDDSDIWTTPAITFIVCITFLLCSICWETYHGFTKL